MARFAMPKGRDPGQARSGRNQTATRFGLGVSGGGRHAPPNGDATAIRCHGAHRLDAGERHLSWGCNGGAAPLAKIGV